MEKNEKKEKKTRNVIKNTLIKFVLQIGDMYKHYQSKLSEKRKEEGVQVTKSSKKMRIELKKLAQEERREAKEKRKATIAQVPTKKVKRE